jgi:hypothetical protein
MIHYCKYVLVALAQHFQRTGYSPPHFIILQEVGKPVGCDRCAQGHLNQKATLIRPFQCTL